MYCEFVAARIQHQGRVAREEMAKWAGVVAGGGNERGLGMWMWSRP